MRINIVIIVIETLFERVSDGVHFVLLELLDLVTVLLFLV